MRNFIFSTLQFLTCQFAAQAQFMVDTINAIEITGKETVKKVSFSTFTSKISLSNSHFGYTAMEQDTSIKEHIVPVAIQVRNTKGVKVRLDSMLVKSTPFDTSKTVVMLNIYAANRLYNAAQIKLVKVDGKASTVYFDTPIFLPADTSYIGFTILTKDNFPFNFYTNAKIGGYLYSYNKQRDAFKLLHFDDMPPVTCPQIQLYYTKME
jgi:hypothetical protein